MGFFERLTGQLQVVRDHELEEQRGEQQQREERRNRGMGNTGPDILRRLQRTGGHLGPNLGVVELTMAIHRTFDSPTDRVVFDTGHQAYVHKMLTGRAGMFDSLRQEGGLSGYPSQAESAHDHPGA